VAGLADVAKDEACLNTGACNRSVDGQFSPRRVRGRCERSSPVC
jgi:hypothetical protein